MADRSKSVTDVLDAKTGLKVMKIRSPGKLILGHVNLNSISNKFNSLIYMLDKNIDIFFISETELDDSFPSVQFKTVGFTNPYWYDKKDKGDGFLLYIREDIPSRLFQFKSLSNIESLSVEINLKKKVVFKLLVQSSQKFSFKLPWMLKPCHRQT